MTRLVQNRVRELLATENISIREFVRQLDAIAKEHNPEASINFESVRRLINNELNQLPLDLMFVLAKRFNLTLDEIFILNETADK